MIRYCYDWMYNKALEAMPLLVVCSTVQPPVEPCCFYDVSITYPDKY